MGICRAIAVIVITGIFFGRIECTSLIVYASEDKLVQYDIAYGEQEQYCVLTEDIGTYEVCAGDSLWGISEKLLGNGENTEKFKLWRER